MKVILNKDIPNLGEEGEIKDVARGYARNFLIPKSLVMPYTRDALSILESRREHLNQKREEKLTAALDTKTRLETTDLVLEMPAGERGRLFGSVTTATIADALAAQGINVERKRLDIPEKTIKMVGTTRVRVRLYGDEEAELKVIVKAAGDEEVAAVGAASVPKEIPAEEPNAAETAVEEPPAEAVDVEASDAATVDTDTAEADADAETDSSGADAEESEK